MMGVDTARNMYSSFPEINKLCKVASFLEIYQKEYTYDARTRER